MIKYLEAKPSPEEYNYLRKSVGWQEYVLGEIQKGLDNTLYCIVVKDNSKAVAMGRVIGDGKLVFYIQDVIVIPEYQKKGIGKNIMVMIMKYIESNSINNSIIGLMSAIGKEEFYKQFGFIQRPNEKMGCGMTVFVKKT